MRTDLRVKHDVEARRKAAELFASGLGFWAASNLLSVPRQTVEKWHQIYRAFGSEVLLTMDGKQAIYTYEQKVAAARADGRMGPPAVVARLDELDDRVPGVGPGGEAFAVVHLEAPMYVNSLFSSEFLTRRHALPGTERS